MASADVKFVEDTLRSWEEELEATGSSGGGDDGGGDGDGEEANGAGKQSSSGDGDGENNKKKLATKATTNRGGGGGGGGGGVFAPSPTQVRAARHLGHRLELARTVAGGVREKIADLKQQLDAQAREVARSKEDLTLAERRLHRARHGGRSTLAQLPLGADACAAPSVYNSPGRDYKPFYLSIETVLPIK